MWHISQPFCMISCSLCYFEKAFCYILECRLGIHPVSHTSICGTLMLSKRAWHSVRKYIHPKSVQCGWGQGSVQATSTPNHIFMDLIWCTGALISFLLKFSSIIWWTVVSAHIRICGFYFCGIKQVNPLEMVGMVSFLFKKTDIFSMVMIEWSSLCNLIYTLKPTHEKFAISILCIAMFRRGRNYRKNSSFLIFSISGTLNGGYLAKA